MSASRRRRPHCARRTRRNAGAVGLRELIRADEVDEVFAILKSREVAVEGQTWNRRYREYMEKIKTGSVFEIAEVLRDLQRLKTDKELSFGERKMLDTARTLLVKEIAVATKSKEGKIEERLDRIFAC
jgi:CarD family transcriptional regulator